MGSKEILAEEIAGLHRGRGVRRAGLASSTGPQLRAAALIDVLTPDAEAGAALVATLSAASEHLPEDLQTVFLLACAITTDEPFLQGRLAIAAKRIDRDRRTVRRRLTTANLLVAERLSALSHTAPPTSEVDGDTGWFVESLDSVLDLTAGPPVFIGKKTIRSMVSQLSTVTEMVGIPRSGRHEGTPEFEVLSGGTLGAVDRISQSVWRYDIALDQVLDHGGTASYEVRITLPSLQFIRPYAVLVPLRPCRSFRTEVRFGTPSPASHVWRLDGLPPAAVEDDAPVDDSHEELAAGRDVVVAQFDSLAPGRVYGLRWRWADPPAW